MLVTYRQTVLLQTWMLFLQTVSGTHSSIHSNL